MVLKGLGERVGSRWLPALLPVGRPLAVQSGHRSREPLQDGDDGCHGSDSQAEVFQVLCDAPPVSGRAMMLGLTQQREAALDARLALCPTSSVRALDDLLRVCVVALR
ncbi:hypothetical protein AV521_44785 [Streptomyces sp. IMTB 2501]|nr:hypothetical protein AV521_44785 [Streptomyces sp. IMTB 2501]